MDIIVTEDFIASGPNWKTISADDANLVIDYVYEMAPARIGKIQSGIDFLQGILSQTNLTYEQKLYLEIQKNDVSKFPRRIAKAQAKIVAIEASMGTLKKRLLRAVED